MTEKLGRDYFPGDVETLEVSDLSKTTVRRKERSGIRAVILDLARNEVRWPRRASIIISAENIIS